ncbi:lipopolysaccharide-induced tumor necrosis factor-alpha factor homolog [Haliotis rufescens]|uniref:lipopolysaccharide-induced tumor necrosis factor-alpha factor homolog n=1 Tax=Haliotis rufescens TaxID=6454 RepID=UPI001EAFA7BD|nr:lipopolysaccharide-induced tumor necrosis factor-alpha factor homolog [Haliotis rufescens]
MASVNAHGDPPGYWDASSQPSVAYPPAQPAYPQSGYPPAQPANPQSGYPPAQPAYPQSGYPPAQPAYPQSGYNPGPSSYGRTTVVVTQPSTMMYSGHMGPNAARVQCPYCHAQVVTSTTHQVGTCTWAAACIICLLGCWAGCCLIPFCVDSTKDVIHQCPNCKNQLGAYRR